MNNKNIKNGTVQLFLLANSANEKNRLLDI